MPASSSPGNEADISILSKADILTQGVQLEKAKSALCQIAAVKAFDFIVVDCQRQSHSREISFRPEVAGISNSGWCLCTLILRSKRAHSSRANSYRNRRRYLHPGAQLATKQCPQHASPPSR
jgi:hypothetical protein